MRKQPNSDVRFLIIMKTLLYKKKLEKFSTWSIFQEEVPEIKNSLEKIVMNNIQCAK